MVVVKDEDSADHAAGHHDHDAGEVSPNYRSLAAWWLDVTNLYNQCHCYIKPKILDWTIFMKRVRDMRTVICSVTCTAGSTALPSLQRLTFSPESGGKLKPRTAMLAIRTQGPIKLEK